MAGTKGNRRVLYTQKVIKESLLELLKEKNIHKVTVTDICKKADINRGTFYSHYKDAHDLLNSMENEFFDTAYNFVKDYSDDALLKVLYLIKSK
ncbi:MAG: TetR/AcrR family transcriptional regulator [Clostridium sp.]|nr:TetR/AcrR family transcriptional regulator [Clostridium sp.]